MGFFEENKYKSAALIGTPAVIGVSIYAGYLADPTKFKDVLSNSDTAAFVAVAALAVLLLMTALAYYYDDKLNAKKRSQRVQAGFDQYNQQIESENSKGVHIPRNLSMIDYESDDREYDHKLVKSDSARLEPSVSFSQL